MRTLKVLSNGCENWNWLVLIKKWELPNTGKNHWFQFQLIRTKLDLWVWFLDAKKESEPNFIFLKEPNQELDFQFYLGVEPELEPFLKNKSDWLELRFNQRLTNS